MPDWFRRRGHQKEPAAQLPDIPAGVFTKCEKCGELLYIKDFERDLKVCTKCSYHHRLGAGERILFTTDPDSFAERDAHLRTSDPLGFPDYADKLEKGVRVTGRNDVLVTGSAAIGGHACALAVADFRFMGGSMGSVFGEKFVRITDFAIEQKLPTILFCASGGARMQEGLFGLMQMAKTSAAIAQLAEAKLPYVVVLTDPTTGGAYASLASLGDVVFAEPGAYVAFAGTRVAQQAQTQKPPPNYQTSEFQEQHGMVDRIVPRKDLRETLTRCLRMLGGTCTEETGNGGRDAAAVTSRNGRAGI